MRLFGYARVSTGSYFHAKPMPLDDLVSFFDKNIFK